MKYPSVSFFFSVFVLTLFFSFPVMGKGVFSAADANRRSTEVERIISHLQPHTSLKDIALMREKINTIFHAAQNGISELEEEVAQLNLATQGGTAAGGESAVAQSITSPEINRNKERKEVGLAAYKLLALVCQENLEILDKARKKRLTRNLIYRGDDMVEIVQRVVRKMPQESVAGRQWFSWAVKTGKKELNAAECKKMSPDFFSVLPAVLLLILILFRTVIRRCVQRYGEGKNLLYSLDLFLLGKSGWLNALLALIAFGVVGSWFYLRNSFLSLLFCWGVFALFYLTIAPIGVRVISHRLLREKKYVGGVGFKESYGLFFALLLLLLSLVVLYSSRILSCLVLPDIFSLFHFVFLLLFLFSLIVLTYLLQRRSGKSSLGMLLCMVISGAFSIVVIEGAGYRNLVDYLLAGAGNTAILLGVLLFLSDVVDVLIRLAAGVTGAVFSRLAGDETEEDEMAPPENALRLFCIAAKLLLYLVFFYLLVAVWGVVNQSGAVAQMFTKGVELGSFSFYPARVVAAVVVLLAGVAAINYIKQLVLRFWLHHSDISNNSRETILTLGGYLGYALLTLIALTIAGVKLTGLSIVLGAFSVGIGFGLQNVVNNFISGLILMFEQPIRRGNWVKVGDEQGYVKRISIRSTVIQTFDKADVIVPNSELISSKVTNLTLNDTRGRLQIPVGVAYGTDTRQVEQLLLQIAAANPRVIHNSVRFQPRVYFLEFGDSSLNFVLNCYLSDINNGLSARSEINFEIDRLFREHGIDIPFPQREVRIKESAAE